MKVVYGQLYWKGLAMPDDGSAIFIEVQPGDFVIQMSPDVELVTDFGKIDLVTFTPRWYNPDGIVRSA